VNLSDADLSNANLSNSEFSGVNASGVNLSGADLSYIYVHDTDLSGARYNDQTIFSESFDPDEAGMVYVPTAVPIPTTAWLFGSALAGLLVARRKNKK